MAMQTCVSEGPDMHARLVQEEGGRGRGRSSVYKVLAFVERKKKTKNLHKSQS